MALAEPIIKKENALAENTALLKGLLQAGVIIN